MDGLDFACIKEGERLLLEKEFTKEEVTQVLREMDDGLTIAFFHICWSVVEKDVMDFTLWVWKVYECFVYHFNS